MSEKPKMPIGSVQWRDLTVDDAEGVRDFYQAVVGWGSEGCSMGDYEDYNMTMGADGGGVAGICHKRGGNAGLPSQWLIYITVADLDESLAQVKQRGGELLAGPKSMGKDRYAIIRDPAGAACGLYQQG